MVRAHVATDVRQNQ